MISVVLATATTVSGMSASGGNLVVFDSPTSTIQSSEDPQTPDATLVFFQTTWNTSAAVVACVDDVGGVNGIPRGHREGIRITRGTAAYPSCRTTPTQISTRDASRIHGTHSSFSDALLVRPKLVTFPSLDGTLLHAQVRG